MSTSSVTYSDPLYATVKTTTENPIEFGWECVGSWQGKYFHEKKVPVWRDQNGHTFVEFFSSALKQTPKANVHRPKNSSSWYRNFEPRSKP